ncbi:MAG: hypothetical protein QM665_05335 [Desulfovibrio sp.]
MENAYYRRTKALMMQIKASTCTMWNTSIPHSAWTKTPSCTSLAAKRRQARSYTAPGVRDAITKAERTAYEAQKAVIGEDFENTTYGWRLSAYHPIFHKRTGEFLGMAGADIISEQYNSVMRIFVIQTVVCILAGLVVFALATYWFSGKVNLIVTGSATPRMRPSKSWPWRTPRWSASTA